MLEEPRSDVVFFQLWDMGNPSHQLRCLLKPQSEHSLEVSKLTIDRTVRGSMSLTLDDVGFDSFACDSDRSHLSEKRLEMKQIFPDAAQRLSFIQLVVQLH
ncbi:MAG: hypothetical protein BVN28_01205 [Nitrospira sp. ST-bin4]|nr:MAG: hypothetical protein BVN28_01205 [Nitrospira sp. ST-bin4]